MPQTTLPTLTLTLALLYLIPQIYGLLKPTQYRQKLRQLPRNNTIGYTLLAIATLWFLRLLQQENISDFAPYKTWMLLGFTLLAIAVATYLKDLLPLRAIALLLLLLAKHTTDTARWADQPWQPLITTLAYTLVLAGMWFTISPWRLRDLIHWQTQNHKKIRLTCALQTTLALLLITLALLKP